MEFSKDKKGALIRYMNEVLNYNYFLINDLPFFKFIYLFRTIFSHLHQEEELATFENIDTYLRERIGDPYHPAYKQAYQEFYFMPRYIYNTLIYYGIDFDEVLKACRTTVILLVHDLSEEKVEAIHKELQSDIEKITSLKDAPYVYKRMERNQNMDAKMLREYINTFHKRLYAYVVDLINKGAGTPDLRYILNYIGISSSISAHLIEKVELIKTVPQVKSYTPSEEQLLNIQNRNIQVIKELFKYLNKNRSTEDLIKLHTQIGWSRKFIYKIVGGK
ncbi:MAG: hypothetical protein ACLFP2_01510 [Candidatus Woesearchaeota archaeon]